MYIDIGAAYGTAKSGVGISSMGVMNPGLVMRCIIPVVMAGVLGIYGLIVAVIIQGASKYYYYYLFPFNFVCFLLGQRFIFSFICMHIYLVVTQPSATGVTKYSSFTGYAHLSAGLCCGLRYVYLCIYGTTKVMSFVIHINYVIFIM